jgi:hypothetical protein
VIYPFGNLVPYIIILKQSPKIFLSISKISKHFLTFFSMKTKTILVYSKMSRTRMPRVLKPTASRISFTTRSLYHQAHKSEIVPSAKNGSKYRSLSIDSNLDCEAIADQCLLEAKLIQQRHRQALAFSSISVLKPSHLALTNLSPIPCTPFPLVPRTMQSRTMMGKFKKRKWQWKMEEEDKEEMGAWAFFLGHFCDWRRGNRRGRRAVVFAEFG